MDDEIETALKQVAAVLSRHEDTLNTLESRVNIVHDGVHKTLEGMSRLKLQLENIRTRLRRQENVLDLLTVGVDRLESVLAGDEFARSTARGPSDPDDSQDDRDT